MTSRKQGDSRRPKKVVRKAKPSKSAKTAKVRKKLERARLPAAKSQLPEPSFASQPQVRERYVITVENIRGDTAIGDLIVTFPRTRDVLARKGLRLEAEDAGDIYMTLDVFSAMNGLETANLVQEIVEVAKEPIAPAPQMAVAPIS
jgi:D-aminopeptidase